MVVLYWTFEMPGYQQIMRSASKDLKQGLGELFSLDKPLSQVDFNKYAANASRYNNYDIYNLMVLQVFKGCYYKRRWLLV